MWTPPLRESFGYPLSLLQILSVSWTLNDSSGHQRWQRILQTAAIAGSTTLYLMSWQFAQFTLFTQVAAIFGLHTLQLIPDSLPVKRVLNGLLVSLLIQSHHNFHCNHSLLCRLAFSVDLPCSLAIACWSRHGYFLPSVPLIVSFASSPLKITAMSQRWSCSCYRCPFKSWPSLRQLSYLSLRGVELSVSEMT